VGQAQDAEPVTNPHAGASRGPIVSRLRLVALAVDWLLNYWTRLVRLRAKGRILVFDHTYFDLVVDPKRYGYRAGPRLARALSWLLPKPDLVFLLDSEPDVLGHRKEEGALSELMRRKHAYTVFVSRLRASHVLNASLPLNTLVDEIQRVIQAWMLEQSLAPPCRLQNPTTASAVTTEGSTVHATALDRGDGER